MKAFNLVFVIFLSIASISCSDRDLENLEYSGTIECKDITVSSQLPGQIESILFAEGDLVTIGDTLAIINHEKLDLQLQQANAVKTEILSQIKMLKSGARKEDRRLAKEALSQAEASFNVAKVNKERMVKLFKSGSITQKQYDDAILAYDVAYSKYNSAKQNVKKSLSARPEQITQLEAKRTQAEASIALLQKNINDCYITSPINGQIVNQFVEESEIVSFMSSIFKVVDLTEAEMKIYVTEIDLAKVKLGENVDVTIDAYNDKVFNGKITFISPEAEFTPKNIQTKDERTKLVFAVKIEIENPEKILKTGLPADVKIKTSK